MKVLFVGDMHLRERELSTTKGLVQSSSDMLDGIIEYVENDEEIKFVIFEGDIQHDTPKSQRTLRETTIWKSKLSKLGSIIAGRGAKFIAVPREQEDGLEDKTPPNKLPLFSLVGNHDIEKKLKSVYKGYNYTFFDDLLYTGTLQNPRGILFKDAGMIYYIQFNNYGEADEPISETIKELDPNIKCIKVLHDTVKVPTSPSWFGLLGEDEYYNGEDILGDCDLAICGHIHEPLAPVVVKGNGKLGSGKTIFIQTGAMGRTSFTDDNMREFGYCTLMDTQDGINVSEVRIPLMDREEYFNWKQIHLNNTKKEAIKKGQMFNLDFGSIELNHSDPKEDIRQLDIEDTVKENCLDALNRVDNQEENE